MPTYLYAQSTRPNSDAIIREILASAMQDKTVEDIQWSEASSQLAIVFTNTLSGGDQTILATIVDTYHDEPLEIQRGIELSTFQQRVIAKQSTPPSTPLPGDRYIVISGQDAWTNHGDDIAEWNGTEWMFYTPAVGDIVYDESVSAGSGPVQLIQMFTGTLWSGIRCIFVSDGVSALTGTPHNVLRFEGNGITPADLGSGVAQITVPGLEAAYVESEGESTSTSATFAQKTKLTFTATEDDYLVIYSAELEVTNADSEIEIQVDVDDGTIIAEGSVIGDANIYKMVSGMQLIGFSSGSHTIDIDFRRVAGSGNANIRRARITAVKIPTPL